MWGWQAVQEDCSCLVLLDTRNEARDTQAGSHVLGNRYAALPPAGC
jgi:hypothetical protein